MQKPHTVLSERSQTQEATLHLDNTGKQSQATETENRSLLPGVAVEEATDYQGAGGSILLWWNVLSGLGGARTSFISQNPQKSRP